MKKQTKLLSLLISLALLLTILPSTVRAEGSQEEPEPVVGECEVFVTNHTVPEDDGYTEAELLEGYLYSISGLYEDNSSSFLAPRPALPGELSSVYNEVKPMVKQVADGIRASTIFEIPCTWTKTKSEWGITGAVTSEGTLTAEASAAIEAAFNLDALMQRMLSEMPYELYWFDKTEGIGMSYRISLSGEKLTVKNLRLSMHISQAYAKINEGGATYDPLTADTARTSAAKRAAENATQVVAANNAKSDHEKLKAYLDYIKDAVSYNNEAANNNATPYGDPWQLIYVFDGDKNTNVVCEGYSKAFKYLCDLSAFTNDITCSLVTGTMAGGTGTGNHMWNVVAIGGSNYLVDVTNCDEGTIGSPNQLFLCGVSGSVNGSYTATAGSSSIIYTYDESTKNNYTEGELKLSPTAYTPSGADIPKIRGKVISYNGNNAFTVTLYQAGTENQVQSIPVSGNKQSGQVTQDFTFKEVDTGTYDLVVTKACHLTYTIKNMVVGESPIDLTAMTGKAYSTITLLAGDVNGDGSINATDLNIVWNAANFNKAVADVSNQLTDVNGDGAVNATDLNNVWNAANFNKGTGDCTFNFK